MTKVTVDDGLRAKLGGLSDQLELCDESGRTLGLFLTEEQYWKLALAAAGCPYSWEEMKRRRQETGGRSLAEILKDLGRK